MSAPLLRQNLYLTYTYDLEKRGVSIHKVDVSGLLAVDAAVLVREKSQQI
ncbi:hypothetical protein [Okeania sp. SIO1F9]|nr:hypothetical protein [Okeania sp. SIO1F9]